MALSDVLPFAPPPPPQRVGPTPAEAQGSMEDALLQQAIQQALARQPAAAQAPAAPLLSRGERLAAGILAGLDPQGYQALVAPEIQRRTQLQQLGLQQQAQEAHQRVQELTSLANLAGDVQNRRLYAQQVQLQGEEIKRKQTQETAAIDKEQRAVHAGFDSAKEAYLQSADGITALVGQLRKTGDKHDAATADVITAGYKSLGARFEKAAQDPTALSRKDLDDLHDEMTDFHKSAERALDQSRAGAQFRSELALQTQKQTAAENKAAAGPGAGKPLPQIGETAKGEIRTALEGARQIVGVTAMFNKIADQVFRGAAYLPKSNEFKNYIALVHAQRSPILKSLIGSGQTASEAERNYGILSDPGSLLHGDRDSVRAAVEAMQVLVVTKLKAAIDTEKDAGRDVTQQTRRYENEVLPKLPPRVLNQVIDVPSDVPEGSELVQYEPTRRIYRDPSGRPFEWTPAAPAKRELPGAGIQAAGLDEMAGIKNRIKAAVAAGATEAQVRATLEDAGFSDDDIAKIIMETGTAVPLQR